MPRPDDSMDIPAVRHVKQELKQRVSVLAAFHGLSFVTY